MKINRLFKLDSARSGSTDGYEDGPIPFITNTTANNGVVRYVTPEESDKVFNGPAICVSGLGHATVQASRFLPKGNGGDSATILVPSNEMSLDELVFYAALFNLSHSWRFSFGRKANRRRIDSLGVRGRLKPASNGRVKIGH